MGSPHAFPALPELVLARVATAGGPYRPGDELSIALSTEAIGRIVAHDAAVRDACAALERAVVPELIAVVVTHPALHYVRGDVVMLSFVDPHIARVHASVERNALEPVISAEPTPASGRGLAEALPEAGLEGRPAREPEAALEREPESASEREPESASEREPEFAPEREPEAAPFARIVEERAQPSSLAPYQSTSAARSAPGHEPALTTAPSEGTGVSIRLDWNRERQRRFVAVVDKLFTIDRLGWYRHALAMRLLIPDEIGCGRPEADLDANRYLQALRGGAIEALGKPLLAACMPNFNVTSEWLESIESTTEARAIAGLRDALLPYVEDENVERLPEPGSATTVGAVARRELLALGAVSVEAFLPVLIATSSHDAALTRCLTEYRLLLIELFGQTARAGELVRLNAMAQPNHSLDDRLWQLVGAVSEAFDGYALA